MSVCKSLIARLFGSPSAWAGSVLIRHAAVPRFALWQGKRPGVERQKVFEVGRGTTRHAAGFGVTIPPRGNEADSGRSDWYPGVMQKNRLEAFSDGVLAIIITIMVLDLRVPHEVDLAALKPVLPVFLSYVLSFIYVGIYWNNHHHLLHATRHVSGCILWANLHLLFWLSLLPFTTGWVGENHLASIPTAIYGVVLLMAAIAYYLLQWSIIVRQGAGSQLAAAIGSDWKGKLSPMLYLVAVPLAFLNPWIANGIYVLVALLWFVPDRRIEQALSTHPE
jgi:uncharacterized membrane protein